MIDENKIINRLSIVGILGNILLSAFKLIAGFVGNSGAMISDAVHSLSDVIATFIAYAGTKLAQKGCDREHPYGHERIECIASLMLGTILFITGALIGISGLEKIISGSYKDLATPGTIALVAAIVSIVVKEAMFWYTIHYAKILRSDAFKADAWHHRSDALSSVASLIGIGGAMMGFPIMDPIATVVICIFIFKVAFEIIRDAFRKMVDRACDDETESSLRGCAESIEGVVRVDSLHTRLFGNRIYVDLEIAVDGDLSVRQGHDIAEKVHEEIESRFCDVKHVMVHVNPDR